ncbi:sigma-54-dependent Fis family transcriptional regulator [Bdellovibrio sp. NC01]|uniref:sigma-54 interaction domain-containing protein n=1 Tax=Bdellovibrio sp. NC01 TaxID=2220073 RepID=UPI0011595C69|nr:sigma 54-interacting transcriptional regulator [Bdellovibrio sp. NC01]QDK38616.1 hypothetical protein DOE51_14015 [Bdellovibrio sp. NC01]
MNKQIQEMIRALPRIAATDANILIQGESGTGKEMLAKYIHHLSPRVNKPMLAINCSAIPENLLESEFFGHRKGSFTGAVNDHKGIFESARGGTVFLDEIGDMPIHLQSKLLRVIQERTVRPIGSSFEHKVDFTIIAATHKNLKSEIRNGKFREDLYYRLNVIPINLPPLRQRQEDIPNLVRSISGQISKKYFKQIEIPFSEAALLELQKRPWPGNVRELENYVERIIILNINKQIIEKDDLIYDDEREDSCGAFASYHKLPTLSDLQDDYVRYVLNCVNLHQGKAAEILGVSRRTISRKLNQKT